MSSLSNTGGERLSSRADDRDSAPSAKPDFFYRDRNKVNN